MTLIALVSVPVYTNPTSNTNGNCQDIPVYKKQSATVFFFLFLDNAKLSVNVIKEMNKIGMIRDFSRKIWVFRYSI
jgi:hypothetical protein